MDKNKDKEKLIQAAAEQWVNILIAHIYSKNLRQKVVKGIRNNMRKNKHE